MLPSVAPRLLPSSLAILAVLFVAVGLLWVWPQPWDDGAAHTTTRAALPALSFSAPLEGTEPAAQPTTVTPLYEDGVPSGFLLGEVHAGSLFARMGLMKGDVLLSLHDLGATGAPQLVMHIERQGRPMRVEYSVPARARSALSDDYTLSRRAASGEGP